MGKVIAMLDTNCSKVIVHVTTRFENASLETQRCHRHFAFIDEALTNILGRVLHLQKFSDARLDRRVLLRGNDVDGQAHITPALASTLVVLPSALRKFKTKLYLGVFSFSDLYLKS